MIDETLRRVLDDEGRATRPAPEAGDDDLRRIYRHMLMLRVMDGRLLSLQRQGRIGFYGLTTGQEAAVTGTAYALRPSDWVFPALRETGVSMWRGTTIHEVVCQLMGNSGDVLIGRQMPMHFSDRKVNSVAWSSVIGTQLVHAMGAAWAAKLMKTGDVMAGYIGDGGTSSSDFHAALNFAAVKQLPVVFVCQNNQWAISVPVTAQTASSSIAVKAVAYGMPGVRVDGNDVLAVIEVMREAVERARSGGGPTFVEALTFRMGGHSSSDDPTRYRDPALVQEWERRDPLARYGAWLRAKGLLTDADVEAWTAETGEAISRAVTESEALPPPPVESLFADVYAQMPPQLAEQMRHAVALGRGTAFEGAFPL